MKKGKIYFISVGYFTLLFLLVFSLVTFTFAENEGNNNKSLVGVEGEIGTGSVSDSPTIGETKVGQVGGGSLSDDAAIPQEASSDTSSQNPSGFAFQNILAALISFLALAFPILRYFIRDLDPINGFIPPPSSIPPIIGDPIPVLEYGVPPSPIDPPITAKYGIQPMPVPECGVNPNPIDPPITAKYGIQPMPVYGIPPAPIDPPIMMKYGIRPVPAYGINPNPNDPTITLKYGIR
jgi:hypothetical protein